MKRTKPVLLSLVALILIVGMLSGGIRYAHAATQAVSLDAANTGQTDTLRSPSATNAHAFRIGAIVTNTSSTNTISNVFGWQFTINYNASAFIPQGDPNSAGLYPDGAFNTVLFGAQTTAGAPNWAGLIAANQAFGSSTTSVSGSVGQINVFITLISPAPPQTISAANLLASVSFELLPGRQATAQSFTITNVIFVNSAGSGIPGPVAALGATETISDNPPVAVITGVTHLANGDPSCVPITGLNCTAYAYSFSGAGSTDPDGTITSPTGYFWDFGDGVQDLAVQGVTAIHDYGAVATVPGKFNVTLRVLDNSLDTGSARDGLGHVILNAQPSHTQILNFLADLFPTASFTASPTSGNSPLAVSFNAAASSDPDGTVVTFFWTFGDGSFLTTCTGSLGCANVTAASHTYTVNSGSQTFTASLVVQDNTGGNSTNTATAAIMVSAQGPAPTVTVNAPTPNPANEGQTVTATWTVTSSSTVTQSCISWGDGASACGLAGSTSATHVYSAGGAASKLFTIRVNATNSAGSGTGTNSVTVNDLSPAVSITSVSPSPANEGQTVTVTVSATDDEAISKTCVNFGDGSSSCSAPFTHVYSTSGVASKIFSITANATDAAGLSTTSTTVNLTVNDLAPTVSITSVSPSPANEGATVTVTVSATDDEAISKTCVNFGDGSSSCTAPFTHVYSTGGVASKIFSITANATDAAGKSTTSTAVNLTVNDLAPTVSITSVSPSPANEGATVTVTVSASDDEAISKTCVSFGDGSSSCSAPFTHIYSTGGVASKIFSITANATDAAGKSTTSTAVNLTVNDLAPTVSITSVSPSPANEGQTVTVTVSATDDEAISKTCVNFGDGSSSCTTPFTHVYSTSGAASKVFSITANATDAAGLSTTSTTVNLTVNDLAPTVSITSVSPNPATSGQTISVSFTATDDEAISKTCISWGDGVSACSITSPVTHLYSVSVSTIFTIKVNATDAAGLTGSATAQETVNPQGVPVVTVNAPTPNPANEGQTVTVTWTVSSSATVTQSCIGWGDGSSQCGLAGVLTANHVYNLGTAASKLFTITVNATNSGGTGQGSNTVTVNDLAPTVSITSVSPSPANEGQPVTVTVSASDDEALSKTCVNFGDGSSSCTAPFTHVYSTGGVASKIFSITANATDAAGKSATSTAASLTVNDLAPVVTITNVSPNPATSGQTVSVAFTATDDEAISKTCISWGDGVSACGITSPVTHAYTVTVPTTFTITVNATDAAGLTGKANASESVNVGGLLVTVNSPTPNPANEGQTVTVTWAVSGSGVTQTCINWGDGSSACGLTGTSTANHVYQLGATTLSGKVFTITVNATNSAGTSQGSNTVTVNDLAPTVTITGVSPNPAITGQTVTVTFSSSDDEAVSSITVNWGDGSAVDTLAGSATSDMHVYASTGSVKSQTFTITVTATDTAGKLGSAMASVTVNDQAPTVTITSVTPNPAVTGQTVTVTYTATDPDGTISSVTVMWGDGSSTTGGTTSATHAYANTGNAKSENFTITVIVTDNSGSTGSASTSEAVFDRPPVAVIAAPSTAVVNTAVTFDGSGSADPDGTVVAWAWTFGDGTTGNGAIVSHTFTMTGTFNVTLAVTDNSGNTATTSTSIMIVQSAAGHASFNGYAAKAQFKKDKLAVHPNQTLLANVVDDGKTNVTVYVEFKVVDGSGIGLTLFTQIVQLSPHQVVDGTSNPAFTATFAVPNTGTFTVTATLFTSSAMSTTIGDPSFVPTGTTTFSFFAF